jgi:hypothetical protein
MIFLIAVEFAFSLATVVIVNASWRAIRTHLERRRRRIRLPALRAQAPTIGAGVARSAGREAAR